MLVCHTARHAGSHPAVDSVHSPAERRSTLFVCCSRACYPDSLSSSSRGRSARSPSRKPFLILSTRKP